MPKALVKSRPSKEAALRGTVSINCDLDLANYVMEKETLTLAAETLKVYDEDSMNAAAALVVRCAEVIKAIEGAPFMEQKAMAYKLHKGLCARYNEAVRPFEEARELLESKIKPFRIAQKQQAAATEQALHQEAISTRESLLAEAAILRKKGRIKEAAAKEAEADMIVAPIIPDGAAEIPGFGERQTWSGVCHDMPELIRAIADGRQSLLVRVKLRGMKEEEEAPLVFINQQALDFLARQSEKDLAIPGCSASDENLSFSVRTV
jgi:hypothetical protein